LLLVLAAAVQVPVDVLTSAQTTVVAEVLPEDEPVTVIS
jgi:hypothetical protein